jgi:hypothetical protein
VNSVVVALYKSPSDAVVARYVFDIALLTGGSISAVSLGSLEAQFRAHLLRLRNIPAYDDSPINVDDEEELRFGFVLYTKGVEPGQKWVPASDREAHIIEDGTTIPLKDADASSDTALIASRIEVPVKL